MTPFELQEAEAFNKLQFNDLRTHVGHKIEIVEYWNQEAVGKDSGCANVAVECETCNCVISSFNSILDD